MAETRITYVTSSGEWKPLLKKTLSLTVLTVFFFRHNTCMSLSKLPVWWRVESNARHQHRWEPQPTWSVMFLCARRLEETIKWSMHKKASTRRKAQGAVCPEFPSEYSWVSASPKTYLCCWPRSIMELARAKDWMSRTFSCDKIKMGKTESVVNLNRSTNKVMLLKIIFSGNMFCSPRSQQLIRATFWN